MAFVSLLGCLCVCSHAFNRSFFCFGSLQIFIFPVFDVFSLSQFAKCCHRNLFFAIWALLFCLGLYHFLCLTWLSAFFTFSLNFIPFLCGFLFLILSYLLIFFHLKSSSQNTLLSKLPVLACQMAFII